MPENEYQLLAGKNKKIKDTIHGYIDIPEFFVKKFIDTEIFQRLRRIEQTSMRVLYPCAHHDRFIHSIGTYHLGVKAFYYLKRNMKSTSIDKKLQLTDALWNSYENSFTIACLLHDCAHSPFSHTFEKLYQFETDSDGKLVLDKKICECDLGSEFIKDFLGSTEPSPHEKTSSYVILRRYKKDIEEVGADVELVVRAIMGVKYRKYSGDNAKTFKNILIEMLHSKYIDVDKLDYILRDSWASGFENISIDIYRLLNSLTVVEHDGKYSLGYKKNALSVIQNVFLGRNYLYLWIYNHHKVTYEQHLLKTSMGKLSKILSDKTQNLTTNLFSTDTFFSPVNFKDMEFYLPSDDDLLVLFKKYIKTIPEIKELFFREHKKSVWKSFAEFYNIFKNLNREEMRIIKESCKGGYLDEYGKKMKTDFVFVEANFKLKKLEANELFIEIDNKCEDYLNYSLNTSFAGEDYFNDFFYIYYSGEDIDKNELIKHLKTAI